MRGFVGALVLLMVLPAALSGCTENNGQHDALPHTPPETLPYREERDPAVHLDLPVWHVGDQWVYELEPQDWERLCADTMDPRRFVSRDEVVGEGVRHDLATEPEIYRVRSYVRGCSGEPIGERDRDWHKGHLAVLDDEGRWEEKMLFPLEDGKRWQYTPEGGVETTAEATHVPAYGWDGDEVEAWQIHLRSAHAEERFWFGVEARNVLYRETWQRDGDTLEPFGTVKLLSYRPAS